MAKDVASRVSSDEQVAAEELRDRAAARFDSIHSRWAEVEAGTQPVDAETSSAAAAAATGAAAVGSGQARTRTENTASRPERGDAELDLGAVRVTPMGIATVDDAEPAPRPRFKTLMGVPRSSPEIDELAGLDRDLQRRGDTVRLERSVFRPLAASEAIEPGAPSAGPSRAIPTEEALPERAASTSASLEAASLEAAFLKAGSAGAEAHSRSHDQPSLAATTWPWERNAAAPRSPRVAPPRSSAFVESSLDVSAEVAALRPSTALRSWLVGLGGSMALLALLALGAPRELTLALRWLSQEYQARVSVADQGHTVLTIVDTPQPLRSSAGPAVSGSVEAAAPAEALSAGSHSGVVSTVALSATAPSSPAGIEAAESTLPAAGSAVAPAQPTSILAHPDARPSFAGAAKVTASKVTASKVTASKVTAAKVTAAKVTASEVGASKAAAAREHEALSPSTRARARVAAARKPSEQPATLAASATKPRAARQNTPRKDAGAGIIRETPF